MANRSTGVVILALLVGVAGLGLGGYATFLKEPVPGPAGQDGTDGLDSPGYYCYSAAEISSALTTIGTGDGCITIMADIILTSTITINQGGSYIIQGYSPGITVDCNGNREAFSIDIVESCILRDLTIDASDITATTTNVIDANSANIRIENVRIFGDGDRLGRGIYINDPYVWVSNCHISMLSYGIRIDAAGDCAHILGNTITDIQFLGINNFFATLITVSNNYLSQVGWMSISSYGANSTYSGNVVVGMTITDSSNDISGMILGGDYDVATGNSITGFFNTDGTRLGIGISVGGDYNVVVGNSMHGNEDNFIDYGTGTIVFGNYYP